jgi:hypothetical protein
MSEPRPTEPGPDIAEFDNVNRKYLDRQNALRYPDVGILLWYTSDTWPPSAETTLADGPAYDCVRLCGFPDGHLVATRYGDDGRPSLHTEFHDGFPGVGRSPVNTANHRRRRFLG